MTRLRSILGHKDILAVIALLLLWLLFFWRLFTPISQDQASLAAGDFSGQFVAFAGYQYARMSQGEIPLWNPYNNGGLPFIADPQAAVYYPPRWLTMGLSRLAGEWSYNALQLEMTFHVLLYTLLMYSFMRRLTLARRQSHLASLAAALTVGYGGYATGYPPLQLAVLEAATWFPLAALGILEATRRREIVWRGLALAGFGLGLSWLAGHPQTSWFMTYVVAAYLLYRGWARRIDWRTLAVGMVGLAVTALGVTAVTFLPGVEYLLQTSRESLGFAAKGNGFPFRDMAQFVWPGSVSLWSPLYVGIAGLFFIGIALWRQAAESRFWMGAALIGLLHSLGAHSAFYYLTYNFIPGLRFFRGQERAAFIVANSAAILIGLGIIAAAAWSNQAHREQALRWWRRLTMLTTLAALVAFVGWMGDAERWQAFLDIAARSAVLALASCLILAGHLQGQRRVVTTVSLTLLIVFDLFSVTMDHPGTYESRPYGQQLSMEPPPLVDAVLQDSQDQPFRVDGFRGLQDNFGSLYGVMDMRGISPLFLDGPQRVIYRHYVSNPLAWELYAVKYVYSGAERISAAARVIGAGRDREGAVYLHQLDDPRPFAHLVYQAAVVDSDEFALALMDDPRFDERGAIVLHQKPKLELPTRPAAGKAKVTVFEPEEIHIDIDTPTAAILSLSQPHYPGWQARLNGGDVDIIRAYGGLSAIEIPPGRHRLRLRFVPTSYTIGGLFSLITWLGLGLTALMTVLRR